MDSQFTTWGGFSFITSANNGRRDTCACFEAVGL